MKLLEAASSNSGRSGKPVAKRVLRFRCRVWVQKMFRCKGSVRPCGPEGRLDCKSRLLGCFFWASKVILGERIWGVLLNPAGQYPASTWGIAFWPFSPALLVTWGKHPGRGAESASTRGGFPENLWMVSWRFLGSSWSLCWPWRSW